MQHYRAAEVANLSYYGKRKILRKETIIKDIGKGP